MTSAIALVIRHYRADGGGAERWTDRHARWLLAQGHEVHLVAQDFRGAPSGAVLHAVPKARGKLAFAAAAEHTLRNVPADAVHDMGEGWACDVLHPHHGSRGAGFDRNTALAPAFARPFRHAAALLPRYREFAALERRQYAKAPLIAAVSEMVARDLRERLGVPPARLRVVRNGIDTARFRPPTADEAAARAALHAAWGWRGRVVACLVAHNFKLKGLDAALRALQRLRRDGAPAALLVAGAGDIRRYQAQAAALGLAGDVRFLGDVPDAAALYRSAELFVMPTFYDPCSLVLLEALAAGLPSLTTRWNGAAEIVTPGVEGDILPEPRDDAALAIAWGRLLEPAVRAAASADARRAAEPWTMERNSAEFLSLYREARRRHAA